VKEVIKPIPHARGFLRRGFLNPSSARHALTKVSVCVAIDSNC
jgi:hypothetical protein